MDRITITNLHIFAFHGVHESEKQNGQVFHVSAELGVDLYRAGHSDDLCDTVSYSDAAKTIYNTFTASVHDLIEYAAYEVGEALLDSFPAIMSARIRVSKPNAPIGLDFENVSVDITLERHTAYLGIGSNMGDRQSYIDRALSMLDETRGISVTGVSSITETEPYGYTEQDPFLNGAVRISTYLPPGILLEELHRIENSCDRVRTRYWGPRTLDLDILLYDDLVMASDDLTIPHPDMHNRSFVLDPLCELAPDLVHPVLGKRIRDIRP